SSTPFLGGVPARDGPDVYVNVLFFLEATVPQARSQQLAVFPSLVDRVSFEMLDPSRSQERAPARYRRRRRWSRRVGRVATSTPPGQLGLQGVVLRPENIGLGLQAPSRASLLHEPLGDIDA